MLRPEQPAAPPVHLADEELSAALAVAVVHRAVSGTTPELMSSTRGWLNPRYPGWWTLPKNQAADAQQ